MAGWRQVRGKVYCNGDDFDDKIAVHVTDEKTVDEFAFVCNEYLEVFRLQDYVEVLDSELSEYPEDAEIDGFEPLCIFKIIANDYSNYLGVSDNLDLYKFEGFDNISSEDKVSTDLFDSDEFELVDLDDFYREALEVINE